ncbi:MAG: hypothetical protein FWG45_07420 [Oscillospiraceae bacterium]|nr:hypothetical protein [Oscillospiraceae bacterium]
MSKFIALVKNETIKLSLRMGTIILLIIAFIASAGICVLSWISMNIEDTWYYERDDMYYVKMNLEELKNNKTKKKDEKKKRSGEIKKAELEVCDEHNKNLTFLGG